MKKNVFFIFVLTALIWSCSTPETQKEKTILGLYTPYGFFQETLNGRVKEVKEQNYWAIEKDGEIIAGKPVTIADRDSVNWTKDFIVNFNQSGLVEKSLTLDENEEVLGSWEVSNKDDLTSAAWIEKDTIRNYFNTISKSESMSRMEYKNAIEDTLLNSLELEFDENGNYATLKFFNFKNEPTVTYVYSYSPEGFLNGYTWSRNDTIRGGMNFTTNQQGFTETQEVFNKMTGKSSLHKYEYEYDEMGNWIKYVAFSDNKPQIVAKRIYNYY